MAVFLNLFSREKINFLPKRNHGLSSLKGVFFLHTQINAGNVSHVCFCKSVEREGGVLVRIELDRNKKGNAHC
jgi:hypothetical protein